MNTRATADAHEIWNTAYTDGMKKYASGNTEHQTRLWTAGLSWYAKSLRDELIDGMAYAHHLSAHINLILAVAKDLETGKITPKYAAMRLRQITTGKPKK